MAIKDEILQNIINAAAQTFRVDSSTITKDTNLAVDLGAKSINYVQVIGNLEEEFDISIDFMAFKKCKQISEAVEYVASQF